MIVTSTPESRLRFILVHALPLCIVWLLLAPLSVLISVHRHRMRKWFPLHIMLSLCVFFVTLMAAYPGYVKSEGKHFHFWHRRIGSSTVLIMILQMLLGIYVSVTYDPDRSVIPLRDKIHWWTGRLVVMLAFVSVLLGCQWKLNTVLTFAALLIQATWIWVYVVFSQTEKRRSQYISLDALEST